jgi:hypothetical protein
MYDGGMKMNGFKILARHKWVDGATITESRNENTETRRYTATVRGWRNWFVWEGKEGAEIISVGEIIEAVKAIRDKIDTGDVSVFLEKRKNETV